MAYQINFLKQEVSVKLLCYFWRRTCL